VTEDPYSLGAYQFIEMDKESQKYKYIVYTNLTSPHSALLYSQFMLESVLKQGINDPDFEFKVRSTPFPKPKAQEGVLFSADDL
jgi:hypothetical protein